MTTQTTAHQQQHRPGAAGALGQPLARMMNFWTRRTYGQEMEPMLALLHHRKVMTAVARFEMGVAKWSTLDRDLKELAILAVACQIGCSWCMDFGYYVSRTNGMPIAASSSRSPTGAPARSTRRWSAGCWSTPRR